MIMKNLNHHSMKTENNQTQILGEKKMKAKKLILGLVALSVLSFAVSADAGVPQLINYQGVLTDTTGCPVEDDDYTIIFRIYDAASGGNLLWSETHDSVSTTQGNLNVLLGTNTSIPDSVFLPDSVWLAVKVGNDAEMTPRQRVVSVGYAFRSGSDGDWTIDGDNIYRVEGKVGIGTDDPQIKLHVQGDSGTAVYARSEDGPVRRYGGKFYGLQGGLDNIGLVAFGGCDQLPCTHGSHSNIGLWAITSNGFVPSIPSGDWAGYFNGDVRVAGDLDVSGSTTIDDDLSVGGTIKLTFDYESAWTGISPDGCVTLTHNLGGDPSKYVVYLYGKSTDGGIHQTNYGMDCAKYVVMKCFGAWWRSLTSTQITVCRASDDDEVGSSGDWYRAKVRILKNQ
jgi:hypothetical protein